MYRNEKTDWAGLDNDRLATEIDIHTQNKLLSFLNTLCFSEKNKTSLDVKNSSWNPTLYTFR
jgi:hypothetical protein